jgi:inorganic pyrophosphatase/manganese-dependent inorganic pyrophosphatase
MRIVTSGARYLDIDAYGGCIAYAELLNLQDVPARAASSSKPNASVPPSALDWGAPFKVGYQPQADDTFAVLDVSDPDFFDGMISDLNRVDEVIDHHPGFESYWQKRLKNKADIEFVGAVCTMIYERWVGTGQLKHMSQHSARLLMCGILDNTLNFGAEITTERDKHAYSQLAIIAKLPEDWPARYFNECEQAVQHDLAGALRNDSKIITFAEQKTLGVGQLVIWDARTLQSTDLQTITSVMLDMQLPWFVNIISISEGRNHIFCTDNTLKPWLTGLLEVNFNGDMATTKRLWLRKEIIKQAMEKENTT